MEGLEGKVAIVTGGGGGIGRAICLRLAREGCIVGVFDIRGDVADESVRQVEAAGGIVEVPDGPSTSRLPATPVDFGSTPAEQRWMAPEHGQHGEEILRELGHDEGHIAQLRSRGILA